MDGRHGPAVGQGDVVELLRETGRDPGVEAHELIRGVAARTRGWSAGARRRKFDPAFSLCHSPLQPVALSPEGWWPSTTEAGQFSGATEQSPGRVAHPRA